jgi:hypothetical protein
MLSMKLMGGGNVNNVDVGASAEFFEITISPAVHFVSKSVQSGFTHVGGSRNFDFRMLNIIRQEFCDRFSQASNAYS